MTIPGFKNKNKRVVLIAALALILLDVTLMLAGVAPILAVLISLALAVWGMLALSKLVLHRSRLIWRLRNRLLVTYIFIGAVPIFLILALSYFGAWIVVGQVATHLVSSELTRRAASLREAARLLSQARPQDRAGVLQQMAPLFLSRSPEIEFLVADDNRPPLRYPPNSAIEPMPAGWDDFGGLLYKQGKYYTMCLVHNGPTQALILSPLSPRVLENLVPGIGALNIASPAASDRRAIDFTTGMAGSVPPAYNFLDRAFYWWNPIETAHWQHPNRIDRARLSVATRTSAVLNVVFADRVEAAQDSLIIFVSLIILLAIVELVSALVGISMTGAITGAVHNLYEGTLRIGRGDFAHRIPVKGTDQLADLGNSFNQMTTQLEHLLVVAKEKERLQSELAIACEVQNQLFPRSAPTMRNIELIGACEPARSVSGDYYDYLCLPNGNLAFALGDVAGKGISAALLMAAIQSIMRTQLLAPQSEYLSTAAIVAQLSRQLYANTSPEKYATFFFGVYDEKNRELTYTNAGHLAPLILTGGNVSSLEVTGTVVGLFPSSEYEERRVTLASGDLLIAYTDGITEPENAYGEEFGADRLAAAVLKHQKSAPGEIVAKVMEAVRQWSTAPELPDDMTVLVARGLV